MDFNQAISIVATSLERIGTTIDTDSYDGLIVKKLAATNTLGDGRGGSHQSHIAITGTQMDLFPHFRADGYFEGGDANLKRYFVAQIPVRIYESNIDYLLSGNQNALVFNDGCCETYTSVLKSKRTDGTEQVEVSTVRMDGSDFIAFRRLLSPGTSLVFLKERGLFNYAAFGIKEEDSDLLSDVTGNFYKLNTSTGVHIGATATQHFDSTNRIDQGINILLYGVPGSGKSWTIEHEYCHPGSAVERLVFHPDYTNSDFVGQILPIVDEDKQVTYEFVPGPFTSILREAYTHPMREYILIIEEINRGNAPAIFGEIFQLLDRTVEPKTVDGITYPKGTSEYGVTHKNMATVIYGDETHKVRIPSNLSIIGTMNTSDQNVFTLDTAFQRRWQMRLIENNFDTVRTSLANAQILDTEVTWQRFCETINALIIGNKSKMASAEDKRLGVYFVHETGLKFDDRALPSEGYETLLEEYNELLRGETAESLSDEQKVRLSEIREAVMHNRMFPEKVIKYLWDDAFKFNPDALFDTEHMDSLEKVIRTFVYANTGRDRFKIFKNTVQQSLYPNVQG